MDDRNSIGDRTSSVSQAILNESPKPNNGLGAVIESLKTFGNKQPVLAGGLILLTLALYVFLPVLICGNGLLLSKYGCDITMIEAYGRDLGFSALRHGHLLMWNPYIYSGAPFFSEGVALLYPINWLHLFLPLAAAINLIIVIHVFLTGFWMFLWLHRRGLSFIASLFGGFLLMFSGPFFMHVYAGHMDNLAAMSWAPFLLIAADMLLGGQYAAGMLTGTFGLAMLIFAGQAQYTYYTLLTLALYMLLNLVKRASVQSRIKCALAMLAIGVSALALTAVQILPLIKQADESSRAGSGVSFKFASMFAFPPENFLTLAAPNFFGNMTTVEYWGQCYLWEMSLFIGIAGLALAIYGAISEQKSERSSTIVLIAALLILALGCHTPLYSPMLHYFPGFNKFRGTSKFAYDAIIFVILLAGSGLDALIAGSRSAAKLAAATAVAACIAVTGGFTIAASAASTTTGALGQYLLSVQMTGETYLPPDTALDPKYLRQAADLASTSLFTAASMLALVALLLWLRPKRREAAYVLALLGVIEVVAFARANSPSFPTGRIYDPQLQSFLQQNLGDGRILLEALPDKALEMKTPAIWGYGSFNLNRYAEFIAMATGANPDDYIAKSYPKFQISPLFALLRLKYALEPSKTGTAIYPIKGAFLPFPHLTLIQNWVVLPNRDEEFRFMNSGRFAPAKTVILETKPEQLNAPALENRTAGSVHIVRDDGDSMEIEGDVTHPAVLLITDAYARGWGATPLAGSAQSSYQLMPADYTLRGIPVTTGHQHLRIEFIPIGLAVGERVTFVAGVCYLTALGWFIFARRLREKG